MAWIFSNPEAPVISSQVTLKTGLPVTFAKTENYLYGGGKMIRFEIN